MGLSLGSFSVLSMRTVGRGEGEDVLDFQMLGTVSQLRKKVWNHRIVALKTLSVCVTFTSNSAINHLSFYGLVYGCN